MVNIVIGDIVPLEKWALVCLCGVVHLLTPFRLYRRGTFGGYAGALWGIASCVLFISLKRLVLMTPSITGPLIGGVRPRTCLPLNLISCSIRTRP